MPSTELPESSTWEPTIYCIRTTDYVAGGVDGVSNRQARQLANRTAYLKDTLEELQTKEASDLSSLSSSINEVRTSAEDATTTANTASQAASLAQNTANLAETHAQDGISKANAAQTKADSAYTLADTANKTAKTASTNANTANSTANNALSNANTAQATAEARLPLAGGTLTGVASSENGIDNISGTPVTQFQGRMANTDYWRIAAGGEGNDFGFVELSTAITGNEPVYIRQYAGEFTTKQREAVLLDRMGNTKFPGIIEAAGFTGTATAATTATTATKLGTVDVGSEKRPIFLSAGNPTPCSETVGNASTPVYIASGGFMKCSADIGSGIRPVYMSGGSITQSTSSVGSDAYPVHLVNGTITASSTTIGTEKSPIYMDNGELKALSVTEGSSTNPVFLSNGVLKACGGSWSKITSSSYGTDSFYIQYSSGLCFQSITVHAGSIRLDAYSNQLLPCSYVKEIYRYLAGFCVLSTPTGAAPEFTTSAIINASGTSCQVWLQNQEDVTVTKNIDATFVIWGMING